MDRMFIKKAVYWGAGFLSVYLFFIISFYIEHDYSFYDKGDPYHNPSKVTSQLHNIYLGCIAYWYETDPANPCTLEIVSMTTYGYIPSEHVVVLIENGTPDNFSAIGKFRGRDYVYQVSLDGMVTASSNIPSPNTINLKGKELEEARKKLNASVAQNTR